MPESPEQLRARLRAEIAAIEKGIPKPSRAPDLPHVREEREDRRPSRASRSLSASAAGGQPSRHDAGEVDEDVRLSDPDAAFRKIERLCLVRERASEQLRQRLEDFKILDRAKCCLVAVLGMDEERAHRYIQKRAMDMRLSQREIAEDILKTYETHEAYLSEF